MSSDCISLVAAAEWASKIGFITGAAHFFDGVLQPPVFIDSVVNFLNVGRGDWLIDCVDILQLNGAQENFVFQFLLRGHGVLSNNGRELPGYSRDLTLRHPAYAH